MKLKLIAEYLHLLARLQREVHQLKLRETVNIVQSVFSKIGEAP